MLKFIRSTEFRVGFLVLIVSILIGILSLQATEDPGFVGGSKHLFFRLDDASGLIQRGAVKMAGIPVGVIKKITLDQGKAKLDMSIRRDVPITSSARIEIRPNGILGDKYVEIVPGKPEDPQLEDGGEIGSVDNKGSMDALLKEVGRITKSIGDIAEELKDATKDGAPPKGPLGRIIKNIDRLTADLADITSDNKQKLNEIVENVRDVTDTINDIVNDEGPHGLKASWEKVANSIDKVERSLANVEEITDKVNSGKGTIGRLINDEQTIEKINTAVDGVNKFVGGANKLQTTLDFHSEYLMEQSLTKSYISVRIQPGLDRYYEIGIVDDPKGAVERVDTTLTTSPDTPGSTTTTTREIKAFRNRVKYNAIFAKNFYNLTVKAGLMENTGGIGFDYYMLRRSLRLSFDAFDLSNSPAHLRAFLRYYFYKGVYLVGGTDDFLSRTGTQSSFAGAGLDLTNDDLKVLMSKMAF